MIRTLCLASAIFAALAGAAHAHALDEYVQATLISLERDRVHVSMRLTPGVAVWPDVLASIDADSNRIISEAEKRSYAERVLGDLTLGIDGARLKPVLISVDFPSADRLEEGLGSIQLELTANLPPGGANRRLVFENHHQRGISEYLVNCLVPEDSRLRVIAQKRNRDQSTYELDYEQADLTRNPG